MTILERLIKFNKDRIPELRAIKYTRMRVDAFRFYRGTCHLFYEDNYTEAVLCNAPLGWLCGDLHLENFGVYKGDDRDLYFDINDFDEAVLGPCVWDLGRFVCSIIVAHNMLGIKKTDAANIASNIIKRYCNTLIEGHARRIELGKASSVLEDLMETLAERRRRKFIDSRTVIKGNTRQIKISNYQTAEINSQQKDKLKAIIHQWAADKSNPKFYNVIDSAVRIAGTGSVGLERYVLLVEGKGGIDGNYMLDLKYAAPSSLMPYINPSILQPHWANDGERVVTLQKRMQAVFPAMLSVVEIDAKPFVIKEMQPSSDKFDLSTLNGRFGKLDNSLNSFADIAAWAQLRSTGRQGSAIADALIDFAQGTAWQKALLDFSLTYADKVDSDFKEFSTAYDDMALKTKT